jgi:hypothetical protein
MFILNKYPKVASVLGELKKEYANNVKVSAPEIFLNKCDKIQNKVNYSIISESYLSSHISDSSDSSNEGNVISGCL